MGFLGDCLHCPLTNSLTSELTHIIVSTLDRTHAFYLDNDKAMVSSVRSSQTSFETSTRTLAVANIMRRNRVAGSSIYEDSSLVIQIVPQGLLLLEYDLGSGEFTCKGNLWTLDKFADPHLQQSFLQEIVAADINASQVIVALSYRWVVQIVLDGDRFVKQRSRQFTDEISAISCVPLDPSKAFTTQFAVSFWKSDHVKMVKLNPRDTTLVICVARQTSLQRPAPYYYTLLSPAAAKSRNIHICL